MSAEIILDAAHASLGRLASTAAKHALLGCSVVIVNCGNARMTGNRRMVIAEWMQAATRGGSAIKGPFLPKKDTARMVKRTIRGMLSYKQQRGLAAWKRIRCFSGTPQEYANASKTSLAPAAAPSLTLRELAEELS